MYASAPWQLSRNKLYIASEFIWLNPGDPWRMFYHDEGHFICQIFWHFILHIFWQTFWHKFRQSVWQLRSSSAHCVRTVAVEVQQRSLRSDPGG